MNEVTATLLEAALRTDNSMTDDEKQAVMDFAKNPTQATSERLVTVKEAARLLSVNEKSVWRMAREGRLHVVPIASKARRVRMSELENIMNGAFTPSRSYCPTTREMEK